MRKGEKMGKKGGKRAPKLNPKAKKFLEEWITGVVQESCHSVNAEELTRIDVGTKVLKNFVKGYTNRVVAGARPAKVTIRRCFEEQLEHAHRRGEILVYRKSLERKHLLHTQWDAILKLQRRYRKRYARRGYEDSIHLQRTQSSHRIQA